MPPNKTVEKDDAEVRWNESNAKATLYADLVSGDIPLIPPENEDEEDLMEYFMQRPEVANHGGFDKFPRRFKALRSQVKAGINRAADDQKAFDMFVKNHPKSTKAAGDYPEWEGSEAQALLKEDMLEGKHTTMQPEELYESREEYKLFPLKVFRDHIYQEIRTTKYLHQLTITGKGRAKWKEFRKDKP